MPQQIVHDNSRIALRVQVNEKELLLRAVALEHTTLTTFILQNALQAAKTIIHQSEHLKLSERDSLRILELLETSSPPNDKLVAAAQMLPQSL